MTKFPSRVIPNAGEYRGFGEFRFRAIGDAERVHDGTHSMLDGFCSGPSCHLASDNGPVILRAVTITDLCPGRPEAAWTRLHYSDGQRISWANDRERALLFIHKTGGYYGTWPYELVEIAYEVIREGQVAGILYQRFRIPDLRPPYPADFLRAAEELGLAPERLYEIVSLHADPRVETAPLPIAS